jgi:hypothetical protein
VLLVAALVADLIDIAANIGVVTFIYRTKPTSGLIPIRERLEDGRGFGG